MVGKSTPNMKNPTLLTLLKQGCKITFPSGYILSGDISNGYINTGFNIGCGYSADGLRILGRDGVSEALKDEKYFIKERKKHE